MITFKDIEFRQHNAGEGSQGLIFFPGGYGLSLVRFKHPYSTRTKCSHSWFYRGP